MGQPVIQIVWPLRLLLQGMALRRWELALGAAQVGASWGWVITHLESWAHAHVAGRGRQGGRRVGKLLGRKAGLGPRVWGRGRLYLARVAQGRAGERLPGVARLVVARGDCRVGQPLIARGGPGVSEAVFWSSQASDGQASHADVFSCSDNFRGACYRGEEEWTQRDRG
jgi:hypothetical protein